MGEFPKGIEREAPETLGKTLLTPLASSIGPSAIERLSKDRNAGSAQSGYRDEFQPRGRLIREISSILPSREGGTKGHA
ncbi:hypothetical protein K0M31_017549 [Melipona bicolor]|uniref:Uncharacterized protein n=1 Tax=Melipona bicolor TaxID=60889 RepID=A0AA40KSS3_9HYME|nr:hypothetical protein K0M31_017549 [Melipona bicolor]